MAFFKLAVDAGFKVEKIWEEVLDVPMFEKDPGVSIASLCSGNSEIVSKQSTDIRIRNRMNYSGERSSDTSFDGQREISSSIDHRRSAYHVTHGKNHVTLTIACEDMHRNTLCLRMIFSFRSKLKNDTKAFIIFTRERHIFEIIEDSGFIYIFIFLNTGSSSLLSFE